MLDSREQASHDVSRGDITESTPPGAAGLTGWDEAPGERGQAILEEGPYRTTSSSSGLFRPLQEMAS